ncbi:MAG: DUF3788 domain-containing protein [Bacteroidales bacterium]|nr:DUF3788 domain-containing protein [Bacteroidales bacterium]MBN2817418.1 DUF3788 domain-containing protein [Bacteroidales bacterium]
MPVKYFDKKELQPAEKNLELVLGNSYEVLRELSEYLKTNYHEPIPEWKFYSPKYGWTLKMLLKKRNLFFLSPRENAFSITFVFGDKALNAINESDLPADIKESLNNARKYAEGRGINLIIDDNSKTEILKQLIQIKIKF